MKNTNKILFIICLLLCVCLAIDTVILNMVFESSEEYEVKGSSKKTYTATYCLNNTCCKGCIVISEIDSDLINKTIISCNQTAVLVYGNYHQHYTFTYYMN